MSVTVSYPVDIVQLDAWIDDGFTTLTLWVANTPDGAYANSGVTPSPTTLALMVSGETYTATFTYSAGSGGLWGKVRAYDGANYSDLNLSKPFHFGNGTTLAYARQRLGKMLDDLITGTTTSSGGTTSAITTNVNVVRWPNDWFNGRFFNRTSGTEEWTQVSDFAVSAGSATITLSPAVASVGSGVTFEVTKYWTPDQYRDAINWAIVTSYPVLSRNIVNTSLRTPLASADDIFEITIPYDIREVYSIEISALNQTTILTQASNGQPWAQLPFEILRDGLVQWASFLRQPADDRRLRIRGSGILSPVYNDTDTIEIVEPQLTLLCYLAAHYLFRLLPPADASTDIDRWKELADYYMQMYERESNKFGIQRPAKRTWGHDSLRLGGGRNTDWRLQPIT